MIQLTPLEFDLLLALALRPQQVLSHVMLLQQVWATATPKPTPD